MYIFDLMRHYLGNGVVGYTYWNPVLLGANNGSSHWGWHQNSMVRLSVVNGTTIYNGTQSSMFSSTAAHS